MPIYEKKPVRIEAKIWDGTASGATPIINWILENGGTARYYAPGEWDKECPKATYIAIDTLEGRMLASPLDAVIKGVKDEFYPCKPGIFQETYDYVPGEKG